MRISSRQKRPRHSSEYSRLLMDNEADDILSSFKLTPEDKAKYDVVKEKFEGYFVKRRNVIFERAKFNQRRQEPGKPIDNFITLLHCLSEHCDYGELCEQMIRDRIVVGIQDISLSEKLQLESNLKNLHYKRISCFSRSFETGLHR